MVKSRGRAAVLLGLACAGGLLIVLHRATDGRHEERTPRPLADVGMEPGGLRARTVFVSANAASGGRGSAAAPYDTVQEGVDAARPGDTVRVDPGTYPGGFHSVRSGTAAQPIRISGSRARVVPDAHSVRLIEINHDYLELSGFEVVGGTAGIRVYGGHHDRILHNVVRDALGECIRVKNQATQNEVAFNTVRDCGRRNFNLAEHRKNGEGVYVGTAPEQLDELPGDGPDRSDRNWIHDNAIDTPAECVDVKEFSSLTLVEHNTCTGGLDPDSAGLSGRGDHVTFRGNTVVGGQGAGIRLGGDEQDQGLHAVVVDNDLENPRGYGVKIMRSPQDVICGNGLSNPGMGASNVPTQDPTAACG